MIPLLIFLIGFGLLGWPLLLWANTRYGLEARFTRWIKHLFFLALVLSFSLTQAAAPPRNEMALICQQLKVKALAEGYNLVNPKCHYEGGYVWLTRTVVVGGVLERRGVLAKWFGGAR